MHYIAKLVASCIKLMCSMSCYCFSAIKDQWKQKVLSNQM